MGEDREQVSDPLLAYERIGEQELRVDQVRVAPAGAVAGDVAGGGELRDDPVGGPFGDADSLADVAQADPRLLRDAHEDLCVVGQKPPVLCRLLGHIRRLSTLESDFMLWWPSSDVSQPGSHA